MTPDPLVNSCASCRFFYRGTCRRFPPRPGEPHDLIANGKHYMGVVEPVWPPVDETDWCGEWQAPTAYISIEDAKRQGLVR